MSQAGLINITGSNPSIPTQFDTDSGNAVPVANILNIIGGPGITTSGLGNIVTISLTGGGAGIDSINVDASTAPGTDPVVPDGTGLITTTGGQVASNVVGANVIRTNSLAANSYTIEIQQAGGAALETTSLNGVSHFNNAQFTVSNGFVSLLGGGEAIDSIAVQTGTSPISPTAGGLVTINGAAVAAGTNPVRSDGTGVNTLALEVQISQALAATDATKIGLSNFDSAAFDVDANGFVQLNGGGIAATSFDVQANTAPGTDPVVPTAAGSVIVNGAAVANHSVVLETRSRAANSYNLEVQYATSAAATDATKSGVAHFNSAQFSVDASGFVALAGGGLAIDSITPNSGTTPVVPDSNGNISILGTGSITAVGSLNTETIQLAGLTNHAVLVGAGTDTITKLAIGTTGQVLTGVTGSDPIWAAPATSGTVTSVSGTVNQVAVATGTTTPVISLVGPYTPSTYTAHGVLIGEGTSSIVATAVGTTGQVLTGVTGSDPVWASPATSGTVTSVSVVSANGFAGTVANATTTPAITLTTTITGVLSGNGTAITGSAVTQFNVLVGGSSNAISSVGPGTSGQLLTSGGVSSNPSYKSFSVVTQVFTATGTYTPTAGMLYCVIECLGSGGGGGGTAAGGAAAYGGSAGGGAGGYARKTVSAATIGASQAVTVGAAGAAGNNAGGTGGTVSVGAIVSASGGIGGGGSAPASIQGSVAGLGGVGTGGDFNANGAPGLSGWGSVAAGLAYAGSGGSSLYGGGGTPRIVGGAPSTGTSATLYGSGGGGTAVGNIATTAAGGAGSKGVIIIREYVIA